MAIIAFDKSAFKGTCPVAFICLLVSYGQSGSSIQEDLASIYARASAIGISLNALVAAKSVAITKVYFILIIKKLTNKYNIKPEKRGFGVLGFWG